MISWTVGAEDIAQKAYSAEEMHPEQNEIQPARGTPHETSSLRPSNVISSSGSEHVFPPAQIQEQIAIKRGSGAAGAASAIFSGRSFSRSVCLRQSTSAEIGFSWRLAASLRRQRDSHLLYPRNRVRRPQ